MSIEWYGVPESRRLRFPSQALHEGGYAWEYCAARHTAGFKCTRHEGHTGRHHSEGTQDVLAVWAPGGQYDFLSFTDAERAALDSDLAVAFFE